MSALGMAPSIVTPMLRLQGILRPPFNLIISNVPGPKTDAVPQRRQDDRHLPAVDPDQRDGAEHHLQQLRRETWTSASPAAAAACRTCSAC